MTLFETLVSIYGQAAYPGPRVNRAVSYVDPVQAREHAGRARSEAIGTAFTALAKAWRRLQEKRQERAATRALSRLDDRLLADIGVNRGDIPYLIVHGLDRRPANDDLGLRLAPCG